jgi:hypothetical protein
LPESNLGVCAGSRQGPAGGPENVTLVTFQSKKYLKTKQYIIVNVNIKIYKYPKIIAQLNFYNVQNAL